MNPLHHARYIVHSSTPLAQYILSICAAMHYTYCPSAPPTPESCRKYICQRTINPDGQGYLKSLLPRYILADQQPTLISSIKSANQPSI